MNRRFASALGLALLVLAAGALALTGNCVNGHDRVDRGSGSDEDDGGGGSHADDDAGDDSGDDDTGGDDSGDDDTGNPSATVLLIHYQDSAGAASLAGFLTGLGYTVTQLNQLDITTAGDVAGYDIIVVAGDTTWQNLPHAQFVMDTGSRVFGFFWGGALFFDDFSLAFGYYLGTTFDGETQVHAIDGSDAIWNRPNAIEVPEGGLVTIFSTAVNQSCFARNQSPMPADVQPYGEVPTYDSWVSLGLEQAKFFYWGYDTNVDDLTDAGAALLANAMALLAE